MANPNNFGVLTGRLTQDPRVFTNKDGSKSVLINLAVEDNFVSGEDRKAKTHFPPVRAYVPASVDGIGSWGRTHKGDLISVATRISAEPYDNKDGERVYPVTIEADGFPQFLESKSVTEARAARNAIAATPAPAQAATPAVEETPEAQIARLQAQLEAAQAGAADTTPFANAA